MYNPPMHNHPALQSFSLLFLRLTVGIVFFFAGAMKWMMWSAKMDGMSDLMWNLMKFLSIVEPLGAIAVILGILTRWASLGFVIIMAGAISIMRYTYGSPYFTMPQAPGLDYNHLILAGSLILVAFGAGKWSLDALLKRS